MFDILSAVFVFTLHIAIKQTHDGREWSFGVALTWVKYKKSRTLLHPRTELKGQTSKWIRGFRKWKLNNKEQKTDFDLLYPGLFHLTRSPTKRGTDFQCGDFLNFLRFYWHANNDQIIRWCICLAKFSWLNHRQVCPSVCQTVILDNTFWQPWPNPHTRHLFLRAYQYICQDAV